MDTILLVEDSKFLRIATERIVAKAGYHVICAGDGDDALSLAASSLPSLVVLDMLLPKLSGPEVLRSLKNNSRTAHIPVIVLSSLPQKNEGKLLKDGAVAYVEKGLLLATPALLLGAIRAALEGNAVSAVAATSTRGAPNKSVFPSNQGDGPEHCDTMALEPQ